MTSPDLQALIAKAETGEDWAEICRIEAEQAGGPFYRNRCDCCDGPLTGIECVNEYDELVCQSCIENKNEAAYDRHQEWLMETGGGPTLQEQQQDAWKIKHGIKF